jgi:hypothetical protein
MNNTTIFFKLDKNRVCNYCKTHEELENEFPINGKEINIALKIKKAGNNKKYDCVLGISGGRDSSYLVYKAKSLGLKPLLVHFNDGFGNPIAGENIRKIIQKTNYDLITITSDWIQSKAIKKAIFEASLPDMTLGTDLGIASALYSVAAKHNVKYILSGVSFRTEGIVPLDWNYLDGKYLKSIVKAHSDVKLKKWTLNDPGFNFDIKEFFYYSIIKQIKFIPLFFHIDYQRSEAGKILKEEFGWQYPGAHYFDDLFQSLMTFILRKKFKIEFRRFNYSALIRTNQMKRNEALEKMKSIYQVEDPKVIQLCIKRLGLSQEYIDKILKDRPRNFLQYKTNYNLIKNFKYPIKILSKIGILPPSLYYKFFP